VASISIDRLTKFYGPLSVLKPFSLDISDGEFVVLVGPSGCGKSTTLKMIAGLEPATSGKIFIGDRDVTDLDPGERDVAMVFQNYALYPHLTVEKNLSFGLRMRNTPAAEISHRVKTAAEMLGISHLLQRRPRALSGGQRQRVALGRAIVREPRAFLMDEPLSNLDAALRGRMRTEISALHTRLRVTTVYVTHDQTEAMTMADRIVVLRDGEIQQVATPAEIFSHPANIFVASFMGSPGMNLFRADLEIAGGKARFTLFGEKIEAPAPARMQEGIRPAIIGIRPEHLYPLAGDNSFTITPSAVERSGSEQLVHAEIPAENRVDPEIARTRADEHAGTLILRSLNATPIAVGASLPIGFDPASLHLFDPITFMAFAR
jgi:multiple sugar transport system ATP-binding protein